MSTLTFNNNLELLGYLLTNPNKALVVGIAGVQEDLFIVTANKLWYAERMREYPDIMSGWNPLDFSYFDQWEFPQSHRVITINASLTG